MFSAADARSMTPSQADIRFNKDLETNFGIIKRVASGGGHEAVLYDGHDRVRMVISLTDAGYGVPNPDGPGCLRATW